FLAGYLEQPDLMAAAARALKMLTFQVFRTKAEFEAWWVQNKHKRYVQIATTAARETDRIFTERENKNAQEIRHLYEQIVDFLVTSKMPDRWKQIQGYIFANKPGVMQACLVKLRDRLRSGIELKGGAEASDRLSLLAALRKELSSELPAAEYALLLEVTSHLITPTELRERAVQEKLLRQGLGQASVDVGLAALRGLRQFPSQDNRLAVVRLAKRARDDNGDRNSEHLLLVAEAVATLKSASWTAPLPTDKDYQEWREVLSRLLMDTRLDGVLRQEVVKALARADKDNGHPAGVPRELSTLAGRASEDLSLRHAALVELPQVLTDADSATDYVTFLVSLLEDQQDEVRREAASQLKRLPYEKDRANEKRAGWQQLLLENLTIQQLLGTETNDRVFQVMVECLVRLPKDNPDHASAVGDRLWRAVEVLHDDNKPSHAFKIPALSQGVVNYATAKERHTIEWVRSCETLIATGDRRSTLAILQARTVKLAPERDEIKTHYHRMRVRLALLLKASDAVGVVWRDKTLRPEALEVIAALQWLAAQKPPAPEVPELKTADVRLLWVCCLAGTLQHQKLVGLATPWLQDNDTVLSGKDRVTAILLMARSQLVVDKKNAGKAVAWLEKLAAGNGNGGAGNALPKQKADLILIEEVAMMLLTSCRAVQKPATPDKANVAALSMLASHVAANTLEKDPGYLRRQLLYLEARSVGADASVRSGLRGQLDRLLRRNAANVPAALRARVEQLRKDLGG
ncbi:MAG: hypothetical protein V3U11_08055, partial [Planctomycetota bacterium]